MSGNKTIPLSRGFTAVIDSSSFNYLNQYKWHTTKFGYAARSIKRGIVYMHRELAYLYGLGLTPDLEIDHINRNKLDNRIVNLRIVTRTINARNQGVFKTNTSGLKGVSFHKKSGKWRASITINNESKHLGLFTNKNEAYKFIQEFIKLNNLGGFNYE